jgi:hypothetical protein
MIRVIEGAGRSVKVPVAQVNQSGFTLPTQGVGQPPPALVQQGDFVAYWPIYSSTDKTFGIVSVGNLAAGNSSSTSTTAGPAAAYLAALVALFTTKANFLGVSESQFRLGETYDVNSQLNQATVNTKDDVWVDCAALVAAKEVGALVTIEGVADTTFVSGNYNVKLVPTKVNFFTDTYGTGTGSTPVVATYAVGTLIERAPAGATSVKVRLKSQMV